MIVLYFSGYFHGNKQKNYAALTMDGKQKNAKIYPDKPRPHYLLFIFHHRLITINFGFKLCYEVVYPTDHHFIF